MTIEFPAHGQLRTSNELRKRGIFVSPSGARSIWLRHHLESFKKRLSALEKKLAEAGLVLTESQVAALELTDRGTEFCGKVEQHDYELYLAVNAIEHTKKKPIIRKLTEFVNAFIKRFFKNFIK